MENLGPVSRRAHGHLVPRPVAPLCSASMPMPRLPAFSRKHKLRFVPCTRSPQPLGCAQERIREAACFSRRCCQRGPRNGAQHSLSCAVRPYGRLLADRCPLVPPLPVQAQWMPSRATVKRRFQKWAFFSSPTGHGNLEPPFYAPGSPRAVASTERAAVRRLACSPGFPLGPAWSPLVLYLVLPIDLIWTRLTSTLIASVTGAVLGACTPERILAGPGEL